MALYKKSAHELSLMLRAKECSAVEITKSVFERINSVEDKVEAYITLEQESALLKAAEVDSALQQARLFRLLQVSYWYKG